MPRSEKCADSPDGEHMDGYCELCNCDHCSYCYECPPAEDLSFAGKGGKEDDEP